MHLENKMITVPTKQGLSENLGGGGAVRGFKKKLHEKLAEINKKTRCCIKMKQKSIQRLDTCTY